jgi:hypothetical protein
MRSLTSAAERVGVIVRMSAGADRIGCASA